MKKLLLSLAFVFSFVLHVDAQYKIGDIYDKDGIKGVVVKVDEKGEHGLVMSLTGCGDRWCKNDVKTAVGATNENDGAANMAAVKKYITTKKLSWDMFPLFNWAKELGEGWYIPAKNELKTIAENINGGSLDKYNQKNFKAFDKILKKNDGKGMIANGMAKSNDFLTMYSSTESMQNMVVTLEFSESAGSSIAQLGLGKFAPRKGALKFTDGLKKMTGGKTLGNQYSRAVHKF